MTTKSNRTKAILSLFKKYKKDYKLMSRVAVFTDINEKLKSKGLSPVNIATLDSFVYRYLPNKPWKQVIKLHVPGVIQILRQNKSKYQKMYYPDVCKAINNKLAEKGVKLLSHKDSLYSVVHYHLKNEGSFWKQRYSKPTEDMIMTLCVFISQNRDNIKRGLELTAKHPLWVDKPASSPVSYWYKNRDRLIDNPKYPVFGVYNHEYTTINRKNSRRVRNKETGELEFNKEKRQETVFSKTPLFQFEHTFWFYVQTLSKFN